MMTETLTPPAPTTSLHLQRVGETDALLTEQLWVGAVVVWNFGSVSMVVGMKQTSKCFYEVTTRSLSWDSATKQWAFTGETYTRRMKIGRAVGYSPHTTAEAANLLASI